ncbi:tetratricopeptide repeat protein [bacterium]|nr:tetratricopeptide repeat protein [bacterium]
MTRPRSKVLIGLVLLLACVVAYANATKGQFVWDDINLIVYDYQIRDLSFVKSVFTRDFFGFQDNARKYGYYRPIVTLTYMLDFRLWGLNPAGYHITNIATHVLATIFLFLIFLRLFDGKAAAPFLAALLFAVHPIHTETVTWIAGRTDSICGMFFFGALLAYMIWAERFARMKGITRPGFPPAGPEESATQAGRRARWLFVSAASFAVALLSKEMAIMLPAVLVLYLVTFVTGLSWRRLLPFAWSLAVFIAVIAGYSLFRFAVIEFSTQAKDPWGAIPTLMSFFWTIAYYLMKMAWPLYQSGYIQNPLIQSAFNPKVIIALVALGGLIWWLWASWEKDRRMFFALGFLLISFGPLSNFIRISGPRDMGFMTAERFVYIPSAAFLLVVAIVLTRLAGGIAGLRADEKWGAACHRAGALAVAAVLMVTYTFLCIERNKDWHTNARFFNDALERAPNAPLLYMMLGNIYSITGEYEEAEATLKLAIEYLSPRDREEPTWIYSDLAGVYAKQGEYDKALEMMKLASRGHMHNSAVEFNLGEIYRMMGDPEKAREYYKRSLAIDRKNIKALEQLGFVLQQLGEWEESNRWYQALLKLVPRSPRVHTQIGRNYIMLREFPRAIEPLQTAMSLAGEDDADLHDLLGNAYLSMGRVQQGLDHIERAVAIRPDNAELRAGLGNALFAAERKREAHAELKKALEIDPVNVRALLGMGILASDQNHPDIAQRTFLKVLKLEPDNVKAMLSLGILAFNFEHPDAAAAWFDRVLKREPDNRVAIGYLAKLGRAPAPPAKPGA